MSLRTRCLVFGTFFGSFLVIGILLTSLTTDYWVKAEVKRSVPPINNSSGYLHYGLFTGNKNLNVGYGPRISIINVPLMAKTEPSLINFWLWLGAAYGTGFALLSSALGATVSVLKAASASKNHGTMALLFIANISSMLSQILALTCWLVQFFLFITHNVLTIEEQKLHWYSEGLASLGYSFYLLIIGILIIIVNIIMLSIACYCERKERKRLEPLYEEKNNEAIMLY